MVLCCILLCWIRSSGFQVYPFTVTILHMFILVFSHTHLPINCFRFFRFMLLLFALHQMALGLFRTIAALARDMIIANTFGSAGLLIIFLLGGFIIPKGKGLLILHINHNEKCLLMMWRSYLFRYDQAMVDLGILDLTFMLWATCNLC